MAGLRKPAGGKPVDVVLVEPIKLDRKRHEPGATLTVPQGVAEELVELGHARLVDAAEAKAKAEAEAKAKAEAEAKAKAEAEAKARGQASLVDGQQQA